MKIEEPKPLKEFVFKRKHEKIHHYHDSCINDNPPGNLNTSDYKIKSKGKQKSRNKNLFSRKNYC